MDSLLPTGFSLREIWDFIVRVFTYDVAVAAGGGMSVSIKSLLLAIIIVFVAIRLSRTAQSLLKKRVLSHVPIDPGLGYTLQRLLHYAVIGFGFLLALRIGVGVDFTGIAVVLTALSVGIGLGLKEISSDVAAGFVLLFERPLRVGDRVKLGGGAIEGDVLAIDLRTTKIRTLDRMTAIVPNSKLTNEIYVNSTYRDGPVRVRVPVGVAYGTDVAVVRAKLLEAAKAVDVVLADPAPDVTFVGFGESTLDFELEAWTNEQKRPGRVRSALNFKIEEKFRDAGIEIPFPQQDINIRTIPQAS